jgi:DNA polymerase (family 10)
MSNSEISDIFKLISQLLELHEANPFKIKGYTGAIYQIDKLAESLSAKTLHELERMGFSANMAAKIIEVCDKKTTTELDELLAKTPESLIEVLQIKGLGAKKVQVLWRELAITSVEQLLEACENNQVAQIKGFGEKTQANILEEISFKQMNSKKLQIDKAEMICEVLMNEIKASEFCLQISVVGEMRCYTEIITKLQFVVATNDLKNLENLRDVINNIAEIVEIPQKSGVFIWRGTVKPKETPLEFYFTDAENYATQLFLLSSAEKHLNIPLPNGKTLMQVARSKNFETEEAIYKAANLPYIVPEMREGTTEITKAIQNKLPNLLVYSDLQGTLHNHSIYSDGRNTLEEMALAARNMGLHYFGIADHSQTAVYANGLKAERVIEQHQEIDRLNEKYAPFKILKGIESDILTDGQLDYDNEILKSFDYVVASIHSSLKMDSETATRRLLKAIENPYTTVLGHVSGRSLLKRNPYPLDYQAIIKACAENNVVIEINASPKRLDLDWRWVEYALECGVMLSINPDAHNIESLAYMKYGVFMGRKGGLTKEKTLNCMNLVEIESFLNKRKLARS